MLKSCVWFLTVAMIAYGAADPGAILKGIVTDDSGAVIPGASVSVTGPGVQKSTLTQSVGDYTFSGLPPGSYTVKVTYSGFAPFEKTITIGRGATQLSVQLAITTEKQAVTVTAEPGPTITVEPDNNVAAVVLKGEDLEALPDDPDDLADALQALAGPSAGPSGGEIFIDGFTGGQLPPKESIREIRVNQNPFSAEYDKLGFGRIEILTKPGTDKFRGMLFLSDSNAYFDSRNSLAGNKPDYSNRQFGGYFSGPISGKASFFMDFNRRDIQDNAVTKAVFLDPGTLALSNINTAVVAPSSNTTISPRIDYQLTTNNTLSARFEERFSDRNNAGLGRYNLPPPYSNLAYNNTANGQNLMITETSILNAKVINETRLQWTRSWTQNLGNELPQINVAGSFVTGGNGVGNMYDAANHIELHNITSIAHGEHTIHLGLRLRRESDQNENPQGFNGTFLFLGGAAPALDAANQPLPGQTVNLTSIQQYERNLLLQQAGYSEPQIQALGGGPSRFTIVGGRSYVGLVRWDAAPFIQDDWRLRPNFTLSMGLRYEVQSLAGDYRDFAPRLGFAWAPGGASRGRTKTVIRGGFGMFYDRIGLSRYESAFLNNGVNQLSYTVYNPSFYPNIPPLSTLSPGQNTTNLVDPRLRADYMMQSAIGIERQLPGKTTAALTYTNTRANHLNQTVPINAPLPGTFNPLLPLGPGNGVFPFGYSAGNIFEYESGGILKQNILMASFNSRFSRRLSLFGNYSLIYANDLPSSPTNPYNFAQDWGRSNLDRRHSFLLAGSVSAPYGLWFAPFLTIRSGSPYDLLIGEDIYGDTLTNARPALAAPGAGCGVAGIVCTGAGTFNTNPAAAASGINLVPRNELTGAPLVSVNLRVYRVFGFGPIRGGNANFNSGSSGSHYHGDHGGGGMRMGSSGFHGAMSSGTTEHRYNVTVGVNVINLLNHFNPAGYVGTLTSPLFGQPTAVNTGFGGGSLGSYGGLTANNRRLDFSIRFTF